MEGLLARLGRVELHNDHLQSDVEIAAIIKTLENVSREVEIHHENRSTLPASALEKLCLILRDCVAPSPAEEGITPSKDALLLGNKEVVSLCTWCLRCLRNSCVHSPSSQRIVWEAGAVSSLQSLIQLVSSAPSTRQEELVVCLRCAVQLLVNLISGQPDLQALMWEKVFPQTLLSVFQCGDTKASQYLCILVKMSVEAVSPLTYACKLWSCDDGYRLVEAILDLCEEESGQDFSLQLMQTLIEVPEFIPSVFSHLTPSSQILLLEILAALVSGSDDALDPPPSHPASAIKGGASVPSRTGLEFLAQTFEEEAGCIFSLVSEAQWSDIEQQKKPLLVMRLLGILCVASSHSRSSQTLQQRASLLECSLGLLDRANNAGKRSDNSFTSTQTLKDAQSNPVFGFKRDLVRLIGNMCHDHTTNQNKVRELHGIPLILEHCRMDDSNPFISQWAIFAIRNLCEGNAQNQGVIGEMTNQGVVNNDQLREYGFQAECRDGTMYYRPTRKK